MALPMLTIAEARRRLADFLSGALAPLPGKAFISYLASKALGIEDRYHGGGQPVAHLVDKATGTSVPAAKVDPVRFAPSEVARLTGRTAPPSATPKAARQAAAAVATMDAATQARATVAQAYRSGLAPILREAVQTGRPPFRSWEDVAITVPAATKGAAYATRDGVGYIGTQVASCAGTPDATRAKLAEVAAKLREKFPGTRIRFVFDQAMTPGTPVLLADRRLAPAATVAGMLAADKLAATIGTTQTAHYAAQAAAAGVRAGRDGAEAVADFRERFKRKEVFGVDLSGAPPPPPFDPHGDDIKRLEARAAKAAAIDEDDNRAAAGPR